MHGEVSMIVREAMSATVLTLGPGHTLREAAQQMHEQKVGSAVVIDPDIGVGIISERAIVIAIASNLDPDSERVSEHIAHEAVYASPEWTLDEATDAMRHGGYRHLVVLEGNDVIGVISLRDIVRAWQPTRIR